MYSIIYKLQLGMTKQYQYMYLKHTDKFDPKFSSEQWVGGVVRLSYTGQNKKRVPLEDK